MSFAWRQFQYALKALGSPFSQRERLTAACSRLVKLRTKDVPGEVAGDFEQLTGAIPRFPAKNLRQQVRNHVESLSDLQVAASIEAIYAMYDAVAAYQPQICRGTHTTSGRCRALVGFALAGQSTVDLGAGASP
jgi:hypothetical protein